MIGTWRVRSLPRISSASSKPSISGICTSRKASATSCTQQQLERLGAGARGQQLHAVAPQQGAEREQVLLEVVDEQALDARGSARGSGAGRRCGAIRRGRASCAAGRRSRRAAARGRARALQRRLRHERRPARCPGPAPPCRPPARCTAARPAAPSWLAPVSTMPSRRSPYTSAADSNSTSIDGREKMHRLVGRERRAGGPSSTSRW